MIHSRYYLCVYIDTYAQILTAPLLGSLPLILLPQFKSYLNSNSKNVTRNTTLRKRFALKELSADKK